MGSRVEVTSVGDANKMETVMTPSAPSKSLHTILWSSFVEFCRANGFNSESGSPVEDLIILKKMKDAVEMKILQLETSPRIKAFMPKTEVVFKQEYEMQWEPRYFSYDKKEQTWNMKPIVPTKTGVKQGETLEVVLAGQRSDILSAIQQSKDKPKDEPKKKERSGIKTFSSEAWAAINRSR